MMWYKFGLLFGTVLPTLPGLARAQSEPPVILPPGTALEGDYSGIWRPQLHFSAPQGFINDPNGMFLDENGTYHLYYQYNPTDTISGNVHWGHATSQDLYTWENQPIVLSPTAEIPGIFSGSAIIDVNNTSGFFPNQTNGVIAFYTAAGVTEQTQALAYSYDDGYTFTEYANNPILSAGSPHFRDPKVIWYEDHWVMVLAFAQEFVISIYTSNNTIDWEFASNFSHHGLIGTQYECPNMIEIPVQGSDETLFLLYLSIQPGAPLGGSIGQYFIGTFNGTHFETVDSVTRIADYGKDNYASQFFYNIPASEQQISIAWASNWQYCNYVPTGPTEGWASVMSLPRVNYLKNASRIGWVMASLPYNLDYLRGSEVAATNENVGSNGTLYADVSSYPSGAFMIDVNVTGFNATGLSNTASINFTLFASGSGETIVGGTFLGTDATQWVDRGNIRGWDNIYNVNKFSAAMVLEDTYDFQIIVDRSIIELFANEGERSATLVYYPQALLDTVLVKVGGLNDGVSVSATIYSLEGTWPSGNVMPNGTDVVAPNGTNSSSGAGGPSMMREKREYGSPMLPVDGRFWRA